MNDVGITELEREEEFIQQWVDLEERLKAPAGKYKLVLIDRFEPLFEGDTTIGIFDTLEEYMKILIMDNFMERDSRDVLGKGD